MRPGTAPRGRAVRGVRYVGGGLLGEYSGGGTAVAMEVLVATDDAQGEAGGDMGSDGEGDEEGFGEGGLVDFASEE